MILFQVGAQMADLRYHVLWSHHLLSCLLCILGAVMLELWCLIHTFSTSSLQMSGIQNWALLSLGPVDQLFSC